jgi:hypothetical protein
MIETENTEPITSFASKGRFGRILRGPMRDLDDFPRDNVGIAKRFRTTAVVA